MLHLDAPEDGLHDVLCHKLSVPGNVMVEDTQDRTIMFWERFGSEQRFRKQTRQCF